MFQLNIDISCIGSQLILMRVCYTIPINFQPIHLFKKKTVNLFFRNKKASLIYKKISLLFFCFSHNKRIPTKQFQSPNLIHAHIVQHHKGNFPFYQHNIEKLSESLGARK